MAGCRLGASHGRAAATGWRLSLCRPLRWQLAPEATRRGRLATVPRCWLGHSPDRYGLKDSLMARKRARIVIIDDDANFVQMATMLFNRANYDAFNAGNGVEGLTLVD